MKMTVFFRFALLATFFAVASLQFNSCLFSGNDSDDDTTTVNSTFDLLGATLEVDSIRVGNTPLRVDTLSVTTPASYFANSVQPIFDRECILCHVVNGIGWQATGGIQNPPNPNALSLESSVSFGLINNVVSYENAPMVRILANDPDNSFLYLKISMENPPGGSRMPAGQGNQLSADEIATIKFWIMSGAREN